MQEVSAYNVFRKHGLGALVDHDLEEHHTIKQLAYKADTTLFSNEQYDEILIKAAQAFITHAEEVSARSAVRITSSALRLTSLSLLPDHRRRRTSCLSLSPR